MGEDHSGEIVGGGLGSNFLGVWGELGWCLCQCVLAATALCLFVSGLGFGLDLVLALVLVLYLWWCLRDCCWKNAACASRLRYRLAARLRGVSVLVGAGIDCGFFVALTPSTSSFILTCTHTLGCFILLTRVCQYSLLYAYVVSSRQGLWVASIIRSPSWGALNISKTTRLSSLSGPIRRMWPSHCNRLDLTHFTRSNVYHFFYASWFTVLSVMIARMVAFTPLIALLTSSVSIQSSEPYVSTLYISAL